MTDITEKITSDVKNVITDPVMVESLCTGRAKKTEVCGRRAGCL